MVEKADVALVRGRMRKGFSLIVILSDEQTAYIAMNFNVAILANSTFFGSLIQLAYLMYRFMNVIR